MKVAIVAITLRRMSGRDVLSGILHHIESVSGWNLRIFQEELNPLTVEALQREIAKGADGIIVTRPGSQDLTKAIARSGLPTVAIGFRDPLLEPTRKLAFVANDSVGIGKLGAAHLISRGGMAAFGFIGTDWSGPREEAFRAEIERLRLPFFSFRQSGAPGSDEDKEALSDYLRRIPKPTGLLAAADWRAEQVLTACAALGIDVPGKVAVLGVDNDEFICPYTRPPLSSIQPGHFEMGEQAISELIRLDCLRKPVASPRQTVVPTRRLFARESTELRVTGTALVSRAKQFVTDNACRGIGVRDVVRHLHVSYRLAELRFKESEGVTLREAIENVRLEKVKRLLVRTDRKIIHIAAECGFNDPNHLSHIFKKRTGQSLRAYRTNAKKASGMSRERADGTLTSHRRTVDARLFVRAGV